MHTPSGHILFALFRDLGDSGTIWHIRRRHHPPKATRRVGIGALIRKIEVVSVDDQDVIFFVIAPSGELHTRLDKLFKLPALAIVG